jgi:2-keto-4-pentenoate hydratase
MTEEQLHKAKAQRDHAIRHLDGEWHPMPALLKGAIADKLIREGFTQKEVASKMGVTSPAIARNLKMVRPTANS